MPQCLYPTFTNNGSYVPFYLQLEVRGKSDFVITILMVSCFFVVVVAFEGNGHGYLFLCIVEMF